MLVPISTLKSSIEKFHTELQLYPLWVCPMRLLTPPPVKWQQQRPANQDAPIEGLASRLPPSYSSGRQLTLLAKHKFPLACQSNAGLVNPTGAEQLYVDIGAYGVPRARHWQAAVRKAYGDDKVRLSDDDNDGKYDSSDPKLHVKVLREVRTILV